MSTHSFCAAHDDSLLRLDIFLTQHLTEAPSRTFIKKLIDGGHVLVNKKIVKAGYKLEEGDQITVEIPEDFGGPSDIEPEDIPLDIFYEDAQLLIINKPVGMLVHPATGCYTGTLVNALLHHVKKLSDCNTSIRPGIVHRLDQDTSGLILVAKDNKTHMFLAKQFENHTVKKRYVALVEGKVEFDEGKIDLPLGRHPRYRDKKAVSLDDDSAKEAITFYKVIRRGKNSTLVALFPQTGRTHQLRVHMDYLKHPILGDVKYGHKHTFSRLALHAQSIGFTHPKSKKFVEFSTPIPPEFEKHVEDKGK